MSQYELSTEDIKDNKDEQLYSSRSPFRLAVNRFKKNKRAVIGLWIVVVFVLLAILAPIIAPYDPLTQNMETTLESPSITHILGTDEFGRDIFSRILYGAQISLAIGFVGVLIALVAGIILGTISGYFGGLIDSLTMRVIDVFMAFPSFLLALAIVSILGPGMINVMIAIGIFAIPDFSRIARSAVISVKNMEYIEATKAMGGNNFRIIVKHVIPNCISPIIVIASMRIATAIITAAGLSFLGMGAQPPTPEWGAMLSSGREYLRVAPHLSTFPGIAIMLLVLGFNMLGDGIRDALDPKMKV